MTYVRKILEKNAAKKKKAKEDKKNGIHLSEKKVGAGRPRMKLDWDYIDSLLAAGCSGVQIAAHLGMHYETFYMTCAKDHDMTFTDYSRMKKAKGESMLKKAQFDLAMQKDKTMLVWLGKQRLNQTDRPQMKHEVPAVVLEFIDLLKQTNTKSIELEEVSTDKNVLPYAGEAVDEAEEK